MPASRLVTVGGSEVGAIAGLDPWLDPTTLAARKLGLIPEQAESEAMRIGTLLEPFVAALAHEAGYPRLSEAGTEYRDPARKWATGHPDGLTNVDKTPAVLELKTVGQLAHREGLEGSPPLRYQAQCQWYMHLTGLDAAVLVALVGGQRLDVYHLTREDDAIDALLGEAEAFVKLVRRGKLPDPDGSQSARATLLQLHPEHVAGQVVRAGKLELAALDELRVIREAEADLEAQRTQAENVLKLALGDAETLIHPDDRPLVHWRTVTYSRLDGKRLRADHPELADEYTNVTTTRRFTLA